MSSSSCLNYSLSFPQIEFVQALFLNIWPKMLTLCELACTILLNIPVISQKWSSSTFETFRLSLIRSEVWCIGNDFRRKHYLMMIKESQMHCGYLKTNLEHLCVQEGGWWSRTKASPSLLWRRGANRMEACLKTLCSRRRTSLCSTREMKLAKSPGKDPR